MRKPVRIAMPLILMRGSCLSKSTPELLGIGLDVNIDLYIFLIRNIACPEIVEVRSASSINSIAPQLGQKSNEDEPLPINVTNFSWTETGRLFGLCEDIIR